MLSGRRLDLLDPSPLDIEIRDIAHGLARVSRWNGQTVGEYPYSVAQHSLLVERILACQTPDATAADRLAALLHDAPEYVVGDLISPFKAVIGSAYKAVEERIAHAVHLRFALPADPRGLRSRRIKSADIAAAYHEAVALAGFTPEEAHRFFGRPRVKEADVTEFLVPWSTATVETRFLAAFEALERDLG
ncbi:HD domain-containing protein [Acuticoccus mangrovi]|uniref:HD family hydrolase n=1 Tax=Acuticoccus mangrovi TaxID=2796142 RepID=A0A934MF52_9HYPH|nr:HD family hydrolase [Acuticoccus mangrovi]MBJ3778287.1 HD family hydrolase [Acuticoccus mangrovi]